MRSWPTCITAITSASNGWPGSPASCSALTISEGAVANALRRPETPLEAERAAIREILRAAEVVWSDETTTRINGRLHWHWVFVTPDAVLHEIAPRRAKAVAEAVMGGHNADSGEAGHLFQFHSGHHSDLKPDTFWSDPGSLLMF